MLEAIKDMPVPDPAGEDPKKKLRSFLGLASYVRKFIKNFATIVQPMNRLLETGVPFEWCDKCQSGYDLLAEHQPLGQPLTTDGGGESTADACADVYAGLALQGTPQKHS